MSRLIDGLDILQMLDNGARNLLLDVDRINALNVFPVPDGDTGTNMNMTISGGVAEGSKQKDKNIGNSIKNVARAMVLSARGNSGVILSQFFKGMSVALEDESEINVIKFAHAMKSGTKKAYSVVSNPTEGTMLTVMREAGDNTFNDITTETTFDEYFEIYLKYAQKSLEHTPELLPVLKKAGVIDSGGAGFILIIEGMYKAIKGEIIETIQINNKASVVSTTGFNADSELTYGYCTEFVLQLQNSKVDTKNFDLRIITDFLNTIGNSVVSFKDDDIIKAHVHTFDPGIVLTECRKYGEMLTIKIENMNVQHSESELPEATEEEIMEHKKYAVVAVANGPGLVKSFKEMGVDQVVAGGQTMNTSTNDFITAFNKIDADYILVLPNNGNILMAAQMAADTYAKAKVYVVPTRTIAEGYSAVSMLNFDSNNIDEIIESTKEAIAHVSTLEVTYSTRDAIINDIEIKKGNYICLYNDEIIACADCRIDAVKNAFRAIKDIADKQVFTILCGQDVVIEEFNEIEEYIHLLNSFAEVYAIEGNQDVYSYIIGIE